MMGLGIRKKSYSIGIVRNYGKYGSYIKTKTGWKRIPQGYPKFRRTSQFNLIKSFLEGLGYTRVFIENKNTSQLKEIMREKGLNTKFKEWRKENG